MIVAIEGAPGVGKSATAAALRDAGAYVVPEVNLLFARPVPEPAGWYHDRQAARWEMARLKESQGELAVLDGDPLQPIWLGWIFDNEAWSLPAESIAFYRSKFVERGMKVPDQYVLLHIAEEERRDRMLKRERARGLGEGRAQLKTERYSRMVQPQIAFFNALSDRFPGWVNFVETTSIEETVAAIKSIGAPDAAPDSITAIDFIAEWIATHSAAEV